MAAAAAALMAFKRAQPDPGRSLSNWQGNDPCGAPAWNGIFCALDSSSNVSHVIEMYEILTRTDSNMLRFHSFHSRCIIMHAL